MFNRMSALWLVLGLAGGYAVAGSPTTAQQENPFGSGLVLRPGDDVTLQFERGTYSENVSTVRCAVAETRGIWIRCAGDQFDPQREQKWYNGQRLILVTKREKL